MPARVTRGPFVLLERDYDDAGRAFFALQEGVEHHITWDELDHPVSLAIGDASAPVVGVAWRWSNAGHLQAVSLSPVSGQTATTTTTFNDFGWPRLTTHPDGTTELRSYDALGRLRFHEDAVGAVSARTYDLRGRVRARDDAGGPPLDIRYRAAQSWGGLTNLRRVTTTAPEGIVLDDYIDAAGRLVAQIQPDGTALRYHHEGTELWATEHLSSAG